jgi:hypothetical protein
MWEGEWNCQRLKLFSKNSQIFSEKIQTSKFKKELSGIQRKNRLYKQKRKK